MTDSNDRIYARPHEVIDRFAFNDKVAAVFPDMIQRSVPGYNTIIDMTGVLAERYAKPGTQCYDLGCSLGASSLSMMNHLEGRDCSIIAVDNSTAMLERFQANTLDSATTRAIKLEKICANIEDIRVQNASVVVLNFTLQFIALAQREALIQGIYEGMVDGGILVLSEKIAFADPHLQELNTDLHHAFKRANGYSDLEISQKRTALENVLTPETAECHETRLKNAGFTSVDAWFQCFNFASFVAIK